MATRTQPRPRASQLEPLSPAPLSLERLLRPQNLFALCWAGTARTALPDCSGGGSNLDAHLDSQLQFADNDAFN